MVALSALCLVVMMGFYYFYNQFKRSSKSTPSWLIKVVKYHIIIDIYENNMFLCVYKIKKEEKCIIIIHTRWYAKLIISGIYIHK